MSLKRPLQARVAPRFTKAVPSTRLLRATILFRLFAGFLLLAGGLPILRMLLWAETIPGGYFLLPMAAALALMLFLGGVLIAEAFGK